MTKLTVTRDKGWADRLRKYRILLDGLEIGWIGEGDMIEQQIAAGSHVIEARIDWCGSRPFRFEAQSDDIGVVVRSALRGWRLFFFLFYIIFNTRGYLALELTQ